MNKKYFIKIIFALSLLVIMNSCVVPRHIRNTFIGCYDGMQTGIDTLLDLSGCFWSGPNVPFIDRFSTTTCGFLVFYNDGMVIAGGFSKITPDDWKSYIQSEFNDLSVIDGDWGLYEWKDSIIRMQLISYPNPPAQYNSYIVRYKVIDRHTIQKILFDEVIRTYRFMPMEQLPSSDCWLKSQKWFWCNESERKAYIDKIKKKKKEKKK